MTASAVVGTETICNTAIRQGAQCVYSSSGGVCNCSGALPSITSIDQCNESGARSAYGIPSIPGVSYSANCSWTETGTDPNTSLAQQQLNPTSGDSGSPSGTPAASTTPATAAAANACDISGYDAGANHGLLKGVQPACAVCGQCSIADIFVVGNTVVELILGLSGSVMLLMIIYGGFLFLTSSGNSEQISKGKKIMLGALVGIVIVFVAYAAVQFILGALGVPNVAEVFSRPFGGAKK